MSSVGVDAKSMVARTIRKLMEFSLECEDGAYLGSEAELLQRFGISRPTLRQAAKVVESDHFLSVRRGVNGGFYAARPDPRQVVEVPALWLRMQSATLADMNQANRMIIPEVAAAAAVCQDAALRAELESFLADIDRRSLQAETVRDSIRQETALARLLARMSGNPVLRLFIDIAYSFGLLDRSLNFNGSSERRAQWLGAQRRLCEAILAGDSEIARLQQQRRGDMINQWLTADRKGA